MKEGNVCKGGQNIPEPGELERRPPAPGGSGGKKALSDDLYQSCVVCDGKGWIERGGEIEACKLCDQKCVMPVGVTERQLRRMHQKAELALRLQQQVDAIREAVEAIVCTEGEDKGVVMVDHESATKYDPESGCHVYLHENFSPLGGALIALHELCKTQGR